MNTHFIRSVNLLKLCVFYFHSLVLAVFLESEIDFFHSNDMPIHLFRTHTDNTIGQIHVYSMTIFIYGENHDNSYNVYVH